VAAGLRPGGGEAVVQHPPGRGGLSVGAVDRHEAGLELEAGGHAVERLQPLPGDRLRVAVQIDEPGPDHEAGDVDDRRLGLVERHRRNAGHPVAAHDHVGDRLGA
jgi:hypothetical protein